GPRDRTLGREGIGGGDQRHPAADAEHRALSRQMPATPAPNPRDSAPPRRAGEPPRFRIGWSWVITFAVLLLLNILITNVFSTGKPSRVTIPYTTFKQQVVADNVQSVVVSGDVIDGHAAKPITPPGAGSSSKD